MLNDTDTSATALPARSSPTMSAISDWRAGTTKANATPCTADAASRWPQATTSSLIATATEAALAAIRSWPICRMRLRGIRSDSAPPSSDSVSMGSAKPMLTRPRMNAESVSS